MWLKLVLVHKRKDVIRTMRRLASQALSRVRIVTDDGWLRLPENLVRLSATFLSDDDLVAAFTATAPLVEWQGVMAQELWDQTLF